MQPTSDRRRRAPGPPDYWGAAGSSRQAAAAFDLAARRTAAGAAAGKLFRSAAGRTPAAVFPGWRAPLVPAGPVNRSRECELQDQPCLPSFLVGGLNAT